MSYYDKREQETIYNYDALEDVWYVHSSYPLHIRKLLEYAKVTSSTADDDGRVISVSGIVAKNQVRLFKPR